MAERDSVNKNKQNDQSQWGKNTILLIHLSFLEIKYFLFSFSSRSQNYFSFSSNSRPIILVLIFVPLHGKNTDSRPV